MEKEHHQITKLADKVSSFNPQWGLPLNELEGRWLNVKKDTTMIKFITIDTENEDVYVTVYGSGETDSINWGRKKCDLYSETVNSKAIEGLVVQYDFGFMENLLCFNAKKGVLTIQAYSKFKDNSTRQSYFSREFFTKKGKS